MQTRGYTDAEMDADKPDTKNHMAPPPHGDEDIIFWFQKIYFEISVVIDNVNLKCKFKYEMSLNCIFI